MTSLLLTLCLLASPARAARRAAPPEAQELLRLAAAEPSAPSTARVRVQVFGPKGAAGKAKAQTRLMRSAGPGRRRVEVAGRKAGPLSLLSVSDGRLLLTAWPKAGRGWLGLLPAWGADAERARLESLYDLSVSTGGRVAKKAAWRLDLRSKADGRLRRSVWLEKKDGAVLRREDYRPDGTLLRRERTSRLEEAKFAADTFVAVPPPGVAVASSTTPFASREADRPRADFPARLPSWTPVGYALFDASSAGKSVIASYTDGLTPFTLAEQTAGSARRDGTSYAVVRLKSGEGRLYSISGGVILDWTAGGRDFSLSGDLPEADLARVADSISEAP